MEKRSHILFSCAAAALICGILFSSCEKKEELWELPAPGNETVQSFDLGGEPDYKNVIFYQLGTKLSFKAELYLWDLAFAAGAGDRTITMNGAKEIQVYRTHDTDFMKTYPVPGDSAWQWDNPGGDPDFTAFGDWYDHSKKMSRNEVYMLDMGRTAAPRYRKIKIVQATDSVYIIRCAASDNSSSFVMTVLKDERYNNIHINLSQKKVIPYEPQSDQWDIVFTRYRHVYYDMTPVTPYLLNGVWINTRHMKVYETKKFAFDEIDAAKAAGFPYSVKQDEIGFDWKFFDLEAGKYTVNPKQIFMLKDKEGYYYKMRFIDFYNEQGIRGFPKFTYQRL